MLKTFIIILCFFFSVSFTFRDTLRGKICRLIDVAVLNEIHFTMDDMTVERLSKDCFCVSFTVYIDGKGRWVIEREWVKLSGKVEGTTFLIDIKKEKYELLRSNS